MTRPQRHSRLMAIVEALPPRILSAVTPAAPIVITKGGTYSGNWQSLDYRVPVIAIRTSEPVVIQNSTLSGRGDLIVTSAAHAKVTIRNTTGTALNPNIAGVAPGHFFWA